MCGEWIVVRHSAIVIQANNLAKVAAHVLCRVELLSFAGRNVQIAIRREGYAMTIVPTPFDFRILSPYHLQVAQTGTLVTIEYERATRDRGAAGIVVAGLGVS